MQIALSSELENFVNELVRTGVYPSSEEAVLDAVRLMHEHERQLDELRIGIEQADRGEVEPFDVEEIKARGRGRLAKQRRERSDMRS